MAGSGRAAIGLAVWVAGCSVAGAVGAGNNLLPDIPAASETVELELLVDVPGSVNHIVNAGDGSGRLFIVGPTGKIRIWKDGALLPTLFLDDPAFPADRGMSGVAFHPDHAANGKLYALSGQDLPNASTPDYLPPQNEVDSAWDSILYEYRVEANNPDRADLSTRRELLRIRQPHAIHSVDNLTFGHDGYLYIVVGDGGETRSGTPTHYNTNAQDTTNPYGSVLRIDVDTIGPNGRYGIPPDNPFADGAGGNVPEIYAWGVRAPWRITTDRLTGAIFIGVNGDFTIEQIYRVENGRNYGWDTREGSFLWNPVSGNATVDPAPDPRFTAPLAEYDHNGTTQAFGSVIGGYVYRGSRLPALYGKYLFNDYLAGVMVAMDPATGALQRVAVSPAGEQLQPFRVITWGEDEQGELYLGRSDGEVYRFVLEQPADAAGSVPDGHDTPGTPLTLAKATGSQLSLSWGASCSTSDTDYAVYEGALGSFSSHTPLLCGNGGVTTAAITPSAGDRYYLIVPTHGVRAGSYGRTSAGAERPPGPTPCLLQAIAVCE